jgi:hypothetical protein
MKGLNRPSGALARRILTEVGFEQRLIGFRLRRRAGPVRVTLYSFREVVGFLADGIPQMNIARLAQWARNAMGDGELADRIEAVNGDPVSEREKLLRIGILMAERLLQCERTGMSG